MEEEIPYIVLLHILLIIVVGVDIWWFRKAFKSGSSSFVSPSLNTRNDLVSKDETNNKDNNNGKNEPKPNGVVFPKVICYSAQGNKGNYPKRGIKPAICVFITSITHTTPLLLVKRIIVWVKEKCQPKANRTGFDYGSFSAIQVQL